MQYNAIQHNTIQYNTIQYNTIQYNAFVSLSPKEVPGLINNAALHHPTWKNRASTQFPPHCFHL